MTHYDTLDVTADASADDIKQAFRRKAQTAHPDKGGNDAAMADLNKAYAVLGDAERRAKYDETGDEREPTTVAEKSVHHLAALFDAHLEKDGDIIQMVRKDLAGDEKSARHEIDQLGRKVEKLTRRRNKISVKSGENLVHLLIDGQITGANQQTTQLKELLEIIACTRTLLDEYVSQEAQAEADTDRKTMDLIAAITGAMAGVPKGRASPFSSQFRGF